MKKKLIALMVAVMMLASFAGTGFAAETPTRMVMMFMTFTGAPVDTLLVQDAMNKILVDKLGIEIELQITDIASYRQNLTLALSGGEQVDIAGTVGAGFPQLAAQGYFMDLEENDNLASNGAGIIEQVGQEYIDACRMGGVLYGVPNNRDMAQGRGCAAIATEYLDGIGYKAPENAGEIIPITQEELDEIYVKLHETYPELEVYRPVAMSMSQFSNVDFLGGSPYGVLTNYGESLDVVNLFESDFYKEYCQRMYDYNQKGYISPDAATDTTTVTELVKAGTLMGYTTGGKPGIKQQETNLCGRPMTIFQTLEDYIRSDAVASFPWTIPINTADAEKAMVLLNEFYTNPDLANLLSWGIEGVHYKVLESGLIDYMDGVDATTSGWNHNVAWQMPNQFITHVWNGNDPALWQNIKDFNNNAKKSAAMGFTYDNTNTLTEMTAVQNSYEEFQKSLEFGFVDPAVGIPELIAKLEAAGMNKIIEDKIAQLAVWAETKK